MADTTYPAFEQYSSVTAAYLCQLLQPYHDALIPADSIEQLTAWIPAVLPESSEELNAVVTDSGDVTQGKLIILQTLANVLVLPDNTTATPWYISENKNEIAVRLFGPASDTVSVIVTTGTDSFQHELTEELTYGILVGIEGIPNFILSVAGVVITRDDLAFKYTISEDTPVSRYAVTVRENVVYFNTPDFVQGAITSCGWIGVDPHTIITSLVEISPDGTQLPLNY